METILVTGAAGMVGSHVSDVLREQRRNVVGTGRHFGFGTSGTASPFYACDLLDPDATLALFQRVRPTDVFHSAACVYGIIGNMTNPGQSFLENVRINTNVIEAARQVGVRKVTVMGTGCMYGYPPVQIPLREEHLFSGRPHPSESGYAHAKLAMLAQLETYAKAGDLADWACIISCNLFGPRDKFDSVNGHVVPALIRKFYEAKCDNTSVTVWGDGSAQRDFIYIQDAARAAQIIMDQHTGAINLGTDSVWRIGEIIRVITKISGLPYNRVLWDSSKPNGVDYRGYDLTRLQALGFKPQWSISRGLAETWEWYTDDKRKSHLGVGGTLGANP